MRAYQLRHLQVADAGDAQVVVHAGRRSLAQGRARFIAPAKAIHLDQRALVQRVQFGAQPCRVAVAEVRRQVADAQPAMAVAGGIGQRRQVLRQRAGVAARCRQLRGWIVTGAERGQRRGGVQQLRLVQPGQGGQHRPAALPLAQLQPVAYHVRLRGGEQQAAGQCLFRFRIVLLDFGQPADVVEQLELQRGGAGGVGIEPFQRCTPQIQGGIGLASQFQQRAQAQLRLGEVGADCQCVAVGLFGAARVAGLGLQHGQVVPGRVQQRRVAML